MVLNRKTGGQLHALVVTKDLASLHSFPPLVIELRELGLKVSIIAEGVSVDGTPTIRGWRQRGENLCFAGEKDFQQTPFDFNVAEWLDRLSPDVVITSTGSPNNLEGRIARATMGRVPIVVLEDFPRGWSRLTEVVPTMLLTMDPHSVSLALAKDGLVGTKVSIVGNPSVWPMDYQPPAELAEAMGQLRQRFGKLIIFIGGGTFDDVELFIRCMSLSHGQAIPLLHPKQADLPFSGGRTKGECWRQMFADGLGDRVTWPASLPKATTEDIVALSDVVATGFSNVMYTAAGFGKAVVSLQTPDVMESLKNQSGLTEVPTVKLGLAYPISEPGSFDDLDAPDDELIYGKLRPYNPMQAAGMVVDLFT